MSDSTGLALGVLLDLLLGDPRRGHPVAGFGRAATAWQRRLERDSRPAGMLFAGTCVGAVYAGARLARTLGGRRYGTALAAAATWSVLGGTSLRREAAAMADLLDGGDLDGARGRLPHLCGRDAAGLSAAELARATVESVAENTSDALVAPLLWGAACGVPGLVAYRAVNTLDAMVGHRSPRYLRFGWAAARLDDAANLLPARVTAALVVAAGPDRGAAARAWRRDGRSHPSPNAGPVEAAFAGALGVRLGGRNVYPGHTDDRPVLHAAGRPATTADIRRAAALSARVSALAAVLAVAVAAR